MTSYRGRRIMAPRSREQLLNDKDWDEVQILNGYAVFIGYTSMGIKGLGFLVLTWTTVVLLGGFVSMLDKKDFWCLTFITLVQTAGIFDVVLNEKLSYMISSVFGWMVASSVGMVGSSISSLPRLARALLLSALLAVQLLVLVIVLCPLATIYVFGILMSGGISLWRLIKHDYRGGSGGEASNLVPAMDTLYYLAVLQTVLFCYRFILGRAGKDLAKHVATEDNDLGLGVVYNYLQETKRECEKDPSFAKGRNLVTHAIDMIASNSPVDCISGVKVLCTAMQIADKKLEEAECQKESENDDYHLQRHIVNGQRMLIKHLVLCSASSKHILQKLLETLDSRGLHDTLTRRQAATIVRYLACDINLDEFPRGIYHISSLIGTFQEYRIAEPYQRDYLFHQHEQYWGQHARSLPPSQHSHTLLRDSYRDLLEEGLHILRRLASHEKNCRVMSDTPDLVSKIMAPVTSDILHNTTNDHGAWSNILFGSLRVMSQLALAPGETGTKLRREISSCQGAISTLWRILNCNECSEKLRVHAIWILKHLYMDTETSSREDLVLKKESREDFVRMLLDIFTDDNKSVTIRRIAGAALSGICSHGGVSDATTVIQTGGGDVIDTLTEILVNNENGMCRRAAAIILQHLCTHYTKDDEYLGKLKKAIVDLMPEVLGKLLRSEDKTRTRIECDNNGFDKPETDIENQCDGTAENDEHDTEEKIYQNVQEAIGATRLLSYLLSLCAAAFDTFLGELAPDLARQFHTPSFVNKLKEIIVKHSDLTVENLSLLKSAGKMVIATMKHSSRLGKQEVLASLIEELSRVSKNMQDLDNSMIFSPASRVDTMSKLERRTLASLVKEAKESYAVVLSASEWLICD